MTEQLYPAYAEIDLGAITENVRQLAESAHRSEVMAIVKADAYGHGLIPAARAALRGGASWLGAAQPVEALALRAAGITARLFTWLYDPTSDLSPLLAADIDISVPDRVALDAVVRAAHASGHTVSVHLKIDTGLGRGGSLWPQFTELVDAALRAQAEGAVDVVGVWSHLAFAENPTHPSVIAQGEVFKAAVHHAQNKGLNIRYRHLANSAATLQVPQFHYDLVRPGIAVYGISPDPELIPTPHLTPAMRLVARLALVKPAPPNQGVSYGLTYRTSSATTLAVIPLGYADGIPRHASNAGSVQIAGQRHQVAGRICMDQFVVDLGSVEAGSSIAAGDEVVLFGSGHDGEPTAGDWALAADTIGYEIVTRLGVRVPRVYRDVS